MDTKATASEPFTGGTVIPPNPFIYIYIFEFNFQPIALRCVWFQVLNENWILNRASDQPGMAGIEPIFGIEFIGPSNSQCTL